MKTTRSKRVVSVHDDIRERHRKRQLKKKRVRFTVFCICMLLLLMLAASAVVFLTPWFHVTQVSVIGNAQVESADLITASGIRKGESIFAFRMGDVEENLLKVPYIKAVNAKRKLPKTVEIHVEESHAIACIEKDAIQICIDENGEAVYAGALAPEGLVSVTGMEIEGYTLGAPLETKADAQMGTLLELIALAEENGCREGIHSIDLAQTENLRFTYGQGLTVLCGDTFDLSRKLLTFMEVVRELPANAKGEIDLRISGKAYYRP